MIKIKHTKYYEHNMRSNKLEYGTSVGLYCTTHDVKVNLCMSEFSSSKIIEHRFHVNNEKCVDPLLTVGTVRRVPRVENTDDG